jgi:hypothetical protein
MRAYIYRAALICSDCASEIREQRIEDSVNLDFESEDSDHCPQGPYSNGGGEADTPQHCDACGVFLENPLTADGEEYVRESAADGSVPPAWLEYYSYLF